MANKYSAVRTKSLDGIEFDSRKEARRWQELKLLERAGKIRDLRRQVKYVLIPAQKDARGKSLERECAYIADFVYFDLGLNYEVVEDTKGFRTDAYRIKRKLMLERYGIRIQEV